MEDGPAVAFSHARLSFSWALTKLSLATSHPINLAPPKCWPFAPPGPDISEVTSTLEPQTPGKRRAGTSCRALLQPPGMLFEINREYECYALFGSEQGDALEETTIHGNHKVSTCFNQGNARDGKSIWLSTSHNFDTKSSLTSYYSNDFKGGDHFIMNLLHNLSQAFSLATGFRKGSQDDPVFEVELQQDKGTVKAIEYLEANLRTGQKYFHVRTKNILGKDALMTSSYTTDFSDDTALELEVATTISPSFVTTYSMEAKYVASRCKEVSLKLTRDYLGNPEFNMASVFQNDRDQWRWKYRNEARNHHIMGLDWKHGYSSHHYYILQLSSRNTGWNFYAEFQLPLLS